MVDPSYLKRNVFPGESGGDYNALFGYSQRPGGQFAGVNLTDMTVDQALQFAAPSGPYGQWVKGQVGRVATPMGAYQVVGSTLRAAKEGLGLTGSERMTPEVQDQIGQWIYQTQGPGAWEAWGRGGSTGNTDMVRGGAGQTTLMGQSGADMLEQEQPRGLLGGFFGPDGRDRRARLAVGLEGMTLNPNRALIEGLQGDITERRETRAAAAQRNATVEFLRSRGREDLAAAIEGGLPATDAMRLALTPPEAGYSTLTGAQLNAQYGTAFDESDLFNQSPSGQITKVGGGGVNVTTQLGADADAEFFKQFYGGLGKELASVRTQATQAAANIPVLSSLRELYSVAPTGPISGRLAEFFPEANDVSAAIEAARVQLAPQLRVEGSGSTSDIEYAGMLRSLGSMRNSPAANQALLDLMLLKAEVMQAKAAVAAQVRPDGLSPMDAAQQLDEIDRTMWKQSPRLQSINEIISSAGGGAAPVGQGELDGVQWRVVPNGG